MHFLMATYDRGACYWVCRRYDRRRNRGESPTGKWVSQLPSDGDRVTAQGQRRLFWREISFLLSSAKAAYGQITARLDAVAKGEQR
jgi:hypothetical protein